MHIDLYSWHFNLLHGLNKFASIKHTHANHGSKNNSLQTFRHFSMLFPVTALSLLGTMINTGLSHQEIILGRAAGTLKGVAGDELKGHISIPWALMEKAWHYSQATPVTEVIRHGSAPSSASEHPTAVPKVRRAGGNGHQTAYFPQKPWDISLRGQKSTFPCPTWNQSLWTSRLPIYRLMVACSLPCGESRCWWEGKAQVS